MFTAWAAWAQDNAKRLEFEVASVKLHTTGPTERSGIEETPGLIRVENLSLRALIQTAYGVKDFQLVGPGWMGNVSFDITAKPPAGYEHPQLEPLLRDLLADRFKLATHDDSKLTPGYALLVAKGGAKLHESLGPRAYFTVRPGLISGNRSMPELAKALTGILGQPVVDKTGLAATYDIKLEWTPDEAPQPPGGGDAGPAAFEPGLSLLTALQSQLGLRVQTQKVAVDVVKVDHVEKLPTAN